MVLQNIHFSNQKRYLLLALLLTTLSLVLYGYIQPVYTYAQLDARFDAHQYRALYDYFKNMSIPFEIRFPFNTRILAPFLASKMPFENVIQDFKGLNYLSIVLAMVVLVYWWHQLNISPKLVFSALFWLLFHWKGLVRMYSPDPLTADVLGYVLMSLWLVLALGPPSRNYQWLAMLGLAVLGTLQKESFVVVVLMTVWFLPQKRPFRIALVVAALATYVWVWHVFAPVQANWRLNPLVTVLRVSKRYIIDPSLLLNIPTSWLLAFGGFGVAALGSVSVHKINVSFNFITNQRHSLLGRLGLMTLAWLCLSVCSGGDTCRIVFNGMPIIMTYLLLILNQKPTWVWWAVMLFNLPLMRIHRLEPDLGRWPMTQTDWCVECWTLADSAWLCMYALIFGIFIYKKAVLPR